MLNSQVNLLHARQQTYNQRSAYKRKIFNSLTSILPDDVLTRVEVKRKCDTLIKLT